MRALFLIALPPIALAVPAVATDRIVGIGSFDRLRVDGPFEVAVATGSPSARLGGESDAIQDIDVRLDGSTLTVRRRAVGGEPAASTRPIRIALATPSLASVASTAGASIAVARLRGPRVELSVAGAGAIAAAAVDAPDVSVVVAGAGRVTLAGRAQRARLVKNGEGMIDASALDAGDLLVSTNGIGAVTARARYTAQVGNAGTGQVTIAGTPRCVVRPANGGPVACGKAR